MTWLKRTARWLADAEPFFLLAALLLLLFPNRYSPAGLILLLVPWPLRWLAWGHPTRRTPVDWPFFLMLLMVPVTLWATALPDVTWPAVYQFMAGVAVFYGVANWVRTPGRLRLAGWGLVGTGVLLAAIAPFGTVSWKTGRLPFLAPLYRHIPRVFPETINGNVLAGALVLTVPMALALLIFQPSRTDKLSADSQPRSALSRLWSAVVGVLLFLALLLLLAVLLLTQSRGAYIALAVSLWLVIALRWPRLAAGLSGAAIGLISYLAWRLGPLPLLEAVFTSETLAGGLEGRFEVWSRALYMLQDFCFTGIGMGTFNKVANVLYPFFLAGPDAEVPHAHNLFLQVGVDMGFPGLIAYLALLMTCFWTTWRVYKLQISNLKSQIGNRKSELRNPALAAGLLGSLTALVVHGVTDAVSWGTKPAVVAWAVFGLVVALHLRGFL